VAPSGTILNDALLLCRCIAVYSYSRSCALGRFRWAAAYRHVAIVKACPGGEFPGGAKVAALMGGLGRTINGSYAECTVVPATNVALIESDLSWAELAAIPETYATAWTRLFRNLEVERGETLVIRGATSSFGQAAIKLGVSRRNRLACSASRRFTRRIASWKPTRRAERWSSSTRDRRISRNRPYLTPDEAEIARDPALRPARNDGSICERRFSRPQPAKHNLGRP
jgi:hypothetical protein